MKLWKRALALCLTLAMTVSLAACGGSQEETTDQDEPAAEESVTVRAAALKGGSYALQQNAVA